MPDIKIEQERKKERTKRMIKITKATITTTALVISAALIGATGAAIKKNSENTKFTYIADENNDFSAEGEVIYDEVRSWELVEKAFPNGEHKLFICYRNHNTGEYTNVLNNTDIGGMTYLDETIINKEPIEDYLLTYDMVKTYYTGEDIKKLLSLIEKDYVYNYIFAEGKVKYDEVKNWYLVEQKLNDKEHKLLIGNVNSDNSRFTNVLNDKDITDSIINSEPIKDYLLAYDMVKAYYTEKDIENLLSLIEEDYIYNKEKVLEK